MMDIGYIRQINRKKARESRRLGIEPRQYAGEGDTPIGGIPHIGDRRPRGYQLVNTYFVDSSGVGSPGEPALTIKEFIAKLVPGRYYAIIEVGQFQLFVGEFVKKEKKGSLKEYVA